MIRKIVIYNAGPNDWWVEHDGIQVRHLCWEEMLGQVAQLTMQGRPRFNPSPFEWTYEPKQLLAVNP